MRPNSPGAVPAAGSLDTATAEGCRIESTSDPCVFHDRAGLCGCNPYPLNGLNQVVHRRLGKGHVELAGEPPSGLDSSGSGGIAAAHVLGAGVNLPKPKLI